MKIEPGVICVIIGGDRAANIGREVEVVRWVREKEYVPEFEEGNYAHSQGWLVTAPELTGIIYDYELNTSVLLTRDFALYPSQQLIPIKPKATDRPSEEVAKDRELAIV